MAASQSGYVIEYDAPRLDGEIPQDSRNLLTQRSSPSGEAGLLREFNPSRYSAHSQQAAGKIAF